MRQRNIGIYKTLICRLIGLIVILDLENGYIRSDSLFLSEADFIILGQSDCLKLIIRVAI